jgi:hypothetical protein
VVGVHVMSAPEAALPLDAAAPFHSPTRSTWHWAIASTIARADPNLIDVTVSHVVEKHFSRFVECKGIFYAAANQDWAYAPLCYLSSQARAPTNPACYGPRLWLHVSSQHQTPDCNIASCALDHSSFGPETMPRTPFLASTIDPSPWRHHPILPRARKSARATLHLECGHPEPPPTSHHCTCTSPHCTKPYFLSDGQPLRETVKGGQL